MKNILKTIIETFYSICPIKKNTALFRSFFGMYNDHPKYICEELHRQRPDIKIYWAKSNKNRDIFPDYVTCVDVGSTEEIKLSYRAQILVENTYGYRSEHVLKATGVWGKLRGYILLRKRKKQFSCTTWHGTPLKHICADEPNSPITAFKSSCNCIYVGSRFMSHCINSAFLGAYSAKIFGSARNDILFENDALKVISLKKKLQIPLNKRVLLYAPTFRNNQEEFSFKLDFDKILRSLNAKFGGEWCIVLRVHDFLLSKIDVAQLSRSFGVVNGNLGDDMAEYCLCTDVLITDYSGSMFDFPLTGKPCFLYVPDLENYQNNERGFYLSKTEGIL